jgi:hypothetical protein
VEGVSAVWMALLAMAMVLRMKSVYQTSAMPLDHYWTFARLDVFRYQMIYFNFMLANLLI